MKLTSYPHLIAEWHIEKNHDTQPSEVPHKSNKIFWWKCQKNTDHEWKTSVANRVQGRGCPYCSGNKVDHTNNLNAIYPELASEWHPEKNGAVSPSDVFCRSTKKVWWKCSKGIDHEWESSPRQRAKNSSCKFCDGFYLSYTNSLEKTFPDIAQQWHIEKNGDLKAEQFTYRSNQNVWWKCSNGEDHEWLTSIAKRVKNPNCPFCTGYKVSKTNSLLHCFPEIAKEWDFNKNFHLKPADVTYGSSLMVHWKCSRDPSHQWKARINSRTSPSQNNGCRWCSARQKSAPELRLLAELKALFEQVEYRPRIGGKELDLFLPEISIGIEYDGWYFHKNKQQIDSEKNEYFKSIGIKIFRLRRAPLEPISDSDSIVYQDELTKLDLDRILSKISENSGMFLKHKIAAYLKKKSFINPELFNQLLAEFPRPPSKMSLANLHPNIANEWDHEKNRPLTPLDFTPGSDKRVSWKCTKFPEHTWEASISHRTNAKRPSGCPHCNGRGPHRKLTRENSYMLLYPDAAKEWHPERNVGMEVEKVTSGSGKKAHWVCSCCNREWKSVIRKHKTPGCSKKCKHILKKKNAVYF